MAKKKKTRRERRTQPKTTPAPVSSKKASGSEMNAPSELSAKPAPQTTPKVAVSAQTHSFLGRDLTRIGVIIGLCLALELGLWLLFRTSVGDSVYGWVKL